MLLLIFMGLHLTSCQSEQNLQEEDFHHPVITSRDDSPCNPQSTGETQAVLSYIASLSSDPFRGAIPGQNCGHLVNIHQDDPIMSYENLVQELQEETGKWVGILGVDYEDGRINRPEDLSRTNERLIDYWNAGGLVYVGFSPINPWLNDETDIEGNPGSWEGTRTWALSDSQRREINLNRLVDPQDEMHSIWLRKLDRIAVALQELQDAGVVVLFKPLQENNGDWFWWGIHSHPEDPEPYINLYRHLFHYFSYEKGLNNILWMYAPANYSMAGNQDWLKPLLWNYPGEDYVDILTSTVYSMDLTIYGYEEYLETGKPLAMAEYGPDHGNNRGNFDNRTYIEQISNRYRAIAFWVSWEDWDNGDGTNTYMSIRNNPFAQELMNHPWVITREDIAWREFLP